MRSEQPTLTIPQTMQLGREHHQAGRLPEAQRILESVLQVEPEHPDALNLLGVIANQAGSGERALGLIERAVRHQPSNPNFLNNLGVAYYGLRRLAEALSSYDQALAIRPGHVGTLVNRGNVLQQLERYGEAVASYRQALSLNPDHIGGRYNLGNALRNQGRLAEAIDSYRVALAVKPDLAEAHHNLGAALKDGGRLEEAIASFRQALCCKPDLAEVHHNLAVALRDQGRLEDAIASYRQALALKPANAAVLDDLGAAIKDQGGLDEAIARFREALGFEPDRAGAHNNLGAALKDQGRMEEAVARYRQALVFKPDLAEAHHNLGAALGEQGSLEKAIASYGRALFCRPEYAQAYTALGAALRGQGRLDEAIASYRQALAFKPDYAEAYNDLGAALNNQDKREEAVAAFLQAISLKPDYAEAYNNLGVVLKAQGRREQALASYHKALSFKPDFAEARWSIAVSTIPVAYGPGDPPSDRRAEFGAALSELDDWFRGERVKEGFKAVGCQQPFHLAYHEENNRDLLSRYGSLCSRLMDDWLRRQDLGPAATAPKRVPRVGIVSSHFYNHSVWHALLQGWLQHWNRARLELHLFHLGTVHDDVTGVARRKASTFSHGKAGLRQWVETILAQRPEVLVYPEIGMDAMTTKLASMRLAPVQLATWGHPHTTGLPSIDHFVSAEGFEPDHASEHYTEHLIELPHLGCCYPRLPVIPVQPELGALAIDGTLPLLICPGSPFKYVPQHDWVLVEIARRLGRCQFIFFRGHLNEQTEMLHARLRSVFTQAGLSYEDLVVSIPWQPKRAFYGLMRRADVYLDTIGFSGFNTAMQAVECDLPVVAREGKFMRGRLASGILRRMELPELVACTDEAYISSAVRLAADSEYRQRVQKRIRRSSSVLFDDHAPIRALEELLLALADRK